MANPEHLEILKHGVEEWNKWRLKHPDIRPDLTSAYLSETSMDWSEPDVPGILGIANLQLIDFRGVSLAFARLQGANLRGASLVGAKLRGANLRRADLRDADLRDAKLMEANLTLANLGGADVTGATFWETIIDRVNFNGTVGLDRCRHGGPSVIDERTLRRSRGLPQEFLRGCGLSDEFIAYIGSMVGRPIEFYSCFISYSTKDQEFADRLYADLQAKGVRCWFAPEEMKGGRKLHEQIDEAIRLHDKLLLILSEHSMSSPWVKTEIANAREREKREGKQLLFPITLVPFEAIKQWKLFDADIGIDSAREIREYFIPDFSNWKDHDSYQTAFQRLVKDLKAGVRG
jgi:uncharacterized protein YjbI with pentapeptide repeats